MKQLTYLIVLYMLSGCGGSSQKPLQPPALRVVNFDTALHKTDGGWVYKGKPFSGYMTEVERNGTLVYKLPVIDGKEQGLARGWYNSGEKLMSRFFVDGKKEGVFTQWWPNGIVRYLFHFKNDLYNGKQYVYFPDGCLQQESNYVDGAEYGLQSVWDNNGQLISNYTIRNKKLYGVISVQSCIPGTH